MGAQRQSSQLFALTDPDAAPGPVQEAARAMLAVLVAEGVLDAAHDGLMVAHVTALAARLDSPHERAYGLAQVSKELREVYRDLAARREAAKPAKPDPLAGLMDGDDDGPPP